jgi:transcriptional regulator of nitric oxide reductase
MLMETKGCVQPLTTGSVLKIRVFFHSGSVIILSIPEVILLFSTKQSFIIIKKDKFREGHNHSKNVDNSIEYTFTR